MSDRDNTISQDGDAISRADEGDAAVLADNERGGSDLPRRVVVKIGTSTLIDSDRRLRMSFIYELARQVHDLRELGIDVVIVSSGAIGVGLRRLRLRHRPESISMLQAAAAIGQVELSSRYDDAFYHYGIQLAQVLLTRHETRERDSYLHARDTLEQLMELGVVPLVNENDTVSVDEIRFGDNDTLATLVATMVNADLVILLSDIEGLYTTDPRTSEDAKLLEHVGAVTDELYESAGGAGSAYGSGGMVTKLKAARVLMAAGIPMVICQGTRPNVVYDVATGEHVGTMFDMDEKTHHANARKLWIVLGDSPKGDVIVDGGAALALKENGGSLLPVGIREVRGDFVTGDPVNVHDMLGRLVARGLARMSSDEMRSVIGCNSAYIQDHGLLPDHKDPVAVHRDEMVVF